MSKLFVVRGFYKNMRQDELATFAENILTHCNGNANYAMIASEISDLQAAIPTYNEALIAARDGAFISINRRRVARKAIIEALDAVATALEYFAKDESTIVEAGMKPKAKKVSLKGEIPAPQIIRVLPTGNQGEVILQLQIENSKQVHTNAVEYSADNGLTWLNGTYKKGPRLLVTNLPSEHLVRFKVRSIGSFGRVSAWSATVSQVVL